MKQLLHLSLFSLILTNFSACIQDDFLDDYVEPRTVIDNPIVSLEEGTSFQFEISFYDNVGREDMNQTTVWTSSDTAIIEIDQTGLAFGKKQGGPVTITAKTTAFDLTTMDEFVVSVGTSTVIPVVITRTGTVNTTSQYPLTGDFELIDNDGDLYLDLADNYDADPSLPGLYVYLSNNPNSFANAYEIGAVQVFSGAHTYDLPDTIGVNDYQYLLYFCKPFVAKVGHGVIN